jgi:hypothetical protein
MKTSVETMAVKPPSSLSSQLMGSYRVTVGLWPTDERGLVGLGWFCAKPVHVPKCPPTHGTPFIVGIGPPETIVGAPLYPLLSEGAALAVGDTTTAAAHKPISNGVHKRRCWAIGKTAFVGSWTESTRWSPPETPTMDKTIIWTECSFGDLAGCADSPGVCLSNKCDREYSLCTCVIRFMLSSIER